jgi:hypothetical protein
MTAGDQDKWPVSWADHRLEQTRAALQTTAEQRLFWLEQALLLAEATGALRRRREQEGELVGTGTRLSPR